MIQLVEVADNGLRPARRDKHLDSILFGFPYSFDGRFWHFMRVEADEGAVYVKKERFYHITRMFGSAKLAHLCGNKNNWSEY